MAFVHEKDRRLFKTEKIFSSGMKEETLLASKGKCEDGSIPQNIQRNILVHIESNECAMITKGDKIYELSTTSGDFKYEGYMNPTYVLDGLASSAYTSLEAHKVPFNFANGNELRELYYFNLMKREVNNVLFEKISMTLESNIDIYIQIRYSYKLVNPIRFFEFLDGSLETELDFVDFEAILHNFFYKELLNLLNDCKNKGKLHDSIQSKFTDLEQSYTKNMEVIFENMGMKLFSVTIEDSNVIGLEKRVEIQEVKSSIVLELPKSNRWVCTCGCENTTNFCGNCGQKRPD